MTQGYGPGVGQDRTPPASMPPLQERAGGPRTIFGLLWQMVSRRGGVRYLGIEGVNGGLMLLQLLLALAACLLGAGQVLSRIAPDDMLNAAPVMYVLGRATWLVAFAVVLTALALLAQAGVTLLGLLSGLAAMEVLVSLCILPVLVVPWAVEQMLGANLGLMPFMLWIHFFCRMIGFGLVAAGAIDTEWGGGLILAVALHAMAWAPIVLVLALVLGTGG